MERLTGRGCTGQAIIKKDKTYGLSNEDFTCYDGEEGLDLLQKVFDKLAKYEDTEEQGLLLHLPCKIGTAVYHVVKSLSYGELGDAPNVNYRISEVNFNLFMFDFVGESIFLTKEEAEQKLKELTT